VTARRILVLVELGDRTDDERCGDCAMLEDGRCLHFEVPIEDGERAAICNYHEVTTVEVTEPAPPIFGKQHRGVA
jgi:hypothetical protein